MHSANWQTAVRRRDSPTQGEAATHVRARAIRAASSIDLTRRQVLAAIGGIVVAGNVLGDSGTTGGLAPVTADDVAGERTVRYRPAPGGTSIGVEATSGVGTLGVGIDGPNGEPWAITCRHVIDPNYPDSDAADVRGTTVHQPYTGADDSAIGHVEEVGAALGADATDWAVLDLDPGAWTPSILGLGTPDTVTTVSPGDRVVLSGFRSGLWGAEITATGVSGTWRGTSIDGMIEYAVDGDPDMDGNSGALVGIPYSSGSFSPVGLHAIESDGRRYAIPISDALDATGATLSDSPGSLPSPPSGSAWIEAAIGRYDSTETMVLLANIGGETATATVTLTDAETGATVEERSISLDPLGRDVLLLDGVGSRPRISTPDRTITATEVSP